MKRLVGPAESDDWVEGLLSIVVPVYNVERYLDECLDSLRAQQYDHVEIVVVNDGTPDRSMEIARRHQREDPRIRIVERPNGGLSAARNTGIAAARGEFLAFVDSDDVVPPDGYAAAMGSLRSSGSDFAVLPYRRLRRQVVGGMAPWIRQVHTEAKIGVSVIDFPEIQVNALACSKVYRRDFWSRSGLTFREGVIYEDQEVATLAYAKAEAFDVLTDVVYHWRARDDFSSISQAKTEIANLDAMFTAATVSLDVLRNHSVDAVREERARQLLTNDLPQFLRRATDSEVGYLEAARGHLSSLIAELAPEHYRRLIPAQHKVLYHLVNSGQFEAANQFILDGGMNVANWQVGYEDGALVVYLPTWNNPQVHVPSEAYVLADSQVAPWSQVVGASFVGGAVCRVAARVFLLNVDLVRSPQSLRAFAVPASGSHEPIELRCRQVRDESIAELPLPASSNFCDSRDGGCEIDVDVSALAAGTWSIRVEIITGPTRAMTTLTRSWRRGTARRAQALSVAPGRKVTLGSESGTFHVEVVDGISVVHTARVREGSLRLEGTGPVPDEVCIGRRGASPIRAVPSGDSDGWVVTSELDARPLGRGQDSLRITAHTDGQPVLLRHAPRELDELSELSFKEAGKGLRLISDPDRAEVVGFGQEAAHFVVECRVTGHVIDEWEAVFASGPHTHRVTPEVQASGSWTARLPHTVDRWSQGKLALPSANYRFSLVHKLSGRSISPPLSRQAAGLIPTDLMTPDVRGVFQTAPNGAVEIAVKAALPMELRGVDNQTALQRLANDGSADEPAVFFRCLYGEAANDNALALHREIQRRGSHLTCYWSVQDRSVGVPAGGVALLEGSREWYEKLGASRYAVFNVHQPNWYRKPAGQVMIQTFHGYPYKGMGQEWWARSGLSTARIESLLERAIDWDVLVSPATYATPLLLEAFFNDGQTGDTRVLETGYPRNDVLVRADSEATRRRTRELLGIRDDQVVVLYAPTFRDEFSVDGMTTKAAHALDPESLADALGDDFVVLLRGHPFHARAGLAQSTVVDVTYYPDINDLCLASDVGVLDYSSLRFDFALMRKPMVFLVPDKEAYHRLRPAVLAYDDTAPGPHVSSGEQVESEVRDLPALRRRYAEAVELFISTYMDLEDGHATERVVDAVFGSDAGTVPGA